MAILQSRKSWLRQKKNLNHDWKDYTMTMITNPANQGSHHGNQVNQENHG